MFLPYRPAPQSDQKVLSTDVGVGTPEPALWNTVRASTSHAASRRAKPTRPPIHADRLPGPPPPPKPPPRPPPAPPGPTTGAWLPRTSVTASSAGESVRLIGPRPAPGCR